MKEFLQNYKIYEDGRVQRIAASRDGRGKRTDIVGKFLKPEDTKLGYQRITLCNKGITKRFLLHRLVALVHIPNPENKPCVNHLDGDKTNNAVSNLEWCTYSENEYHSHRVLGKICYLAKKWSK